MSTGPLSSALLRYPFPVLLRSCLLIVHPLPPLPPSKKKPKYPYKRFLNPKTGTPFLMPTEFSIGYRWHDILPSHMAVADERNNIYDWIDLTDTAFNATAFAQYGLADILRGMSLTQIPDFHSGLQDNARNVKWNMGYVQRLQHQRFLNFLSNNQTTRYRGLLRFGCLVHRS